MSDQATDYRRTEEVDPRAPKGVPFYSIKSGETRYAKLEAQIQGYINSSDMGINASRDQDYGWRLGADWVKMVRAYRRDGSRMRELMIRNGGQKVTTTQILYAIYGEQMRAYAEQVEEEGDPFEGKYLEDIKEEPKTAPVPDPLPPASFDDEDDTSDLNEVPEDVDDDDLEPGGPPAPNPAGPPPLPPQNP